MEHPNKSSDYVARTFAFDLRSLAVFRIALGLLVLSDLVFRLPTLVAMTSGEGLFTRQLSFDCHQTHLGEAWSSSVWSLFWISDTIEFSYTLFAIAAIAAVFLIIGKWTRWATFVCWLIVASLHARNPMITSSADSMFKMMLFWSIFLPLGKKWSADSRNEENNLNHVLSIATIGYSFQLFALYFFPGIAKWNDIWFNGEAMSYVLRLDIYIREFGSSLLEYPGLLTAITWITLAAEVFLILTLFLPWKNSAWRMINMLVFVAFHIGIALSLGIGLFSAICIVAWLPLIPTTVWKLWLPAKGNGPDNATQQTPVFGWNEKSLPGLAAELFCVLALIIVVAWNVANIEHESTKPLRVPIIQQTGHLLALDQHFQMFGVPPKENPWFVYEALLANGKQIDIWREREVDLEKPDSGLTVFPDFHWRKLHRNALYPTNEFVRQPMLDYVVRRWNENHDEHEQVTRARLICYREPIGPDYNNSDRYSHTWATYQNEDAQPGSLFDSLLESDDPF